MDYKACWEYQQRLFDTLLRAKGTPAEGAGYLLLVEHPAVYTLGKSGHAENLLVGEEYLRSIGAEFYHIDRGGDITFHGPGQIVGYPILDLERIGLSLRDYIDALEGAVIPDGSPVTASGPDASPAPRASWIEGAQPARKICAIGVRASRYVTMHGFALNVATDLRYFTHINPCGFTDRGATSIEKEIGRPVPMEEVKRRLVEDLCENLNVKIYK